MQSDFSRACIDARAAIPVPTVPLEAIRAAAARRTPRLTRSRGFVTTGLAGLSLVAVVAAAGLYAHTHVFLLPQPMLVTGTGKYVAHPTTSDLRSFARSADFRVTLPIGLPLGTSPMQAIVAGKSAIAIAYDLPGAWRRSDHLMWVILADPRVVENGNVHGKASQLHAGGLQKSGDYAFRFGGIHPLRTLEIWQAGGEVVIVTADNVTARELADMKASMQGAK